MIEPSILRADVGTASFDPERQAFVIPLGLLQRHIPAVLSDVLLSDDNAQWAAMASLCIASDRDLIREAAAPQW